MSGSPLITLPPACPFSNTREIHLLAYYKAAYRSRHRLMHAKVDGVYLSWQYRRLVVHMIFLFYCCQRIYRI